VLHNVTFSVPDSKSDKDSQVENELPALSDLEGEVMQIVWAEGPLTAEKVRARLGRLTDSTIHTVLRRLEEKGYVSHALEGRAFVYRAVKPRREVAARAVKRIIEWFCNGSTEELVLGMVDNALLDRQQLQLLAQKVKNAKSRKAATTERTTMAAGRTSKRSTRGRS
jgi:BlaI family transcriptional regulator, penicillinase repressor